MLAQLADAWEPWMTWAIVISGLLPAGALVWARWRRGSWHSTAVFCCALYYTLLGVSVGCVAVMDSSSLKTSLLPVMGCGAMLLFAMGLPAAATILSIGTRRGGAQQPGDGPRCRKCDYLLIGCTSHVCPECGTPIESVPSDVSSESG